MAVVDGYAAILHTGRFHLTGRLARFACGAFHLVYLRGMPNRMSVAQKSRRWHITHEASTRVLIEDRDTDEPAAPAPPA